MRLWISTSSMVRWVHNTGTSMMRWMNVFTGQARVWIPALELAT
jgi:hypothetical protein